MGLFTNRKRKTDDEDLVDPAHAIAIPLGVDDPEGEAHDVASDGSNIDGATIDDATAEHEATAPPFLPAPIIESSGIDVIDDEPEPIEDTAPLPVIDVEAQPIEDTTDATPSLPKRRLADRPRAQAGNVEIDAEGLLAVLGLDPGASLTDVSEAHLRFLADHEPSADDDEATIEIKARIQSEVKSAYASFRLTRLG